MSGNKGFAHDCRIAICGMQAFAHACHSALRGVEAFPHDCRSAVYGVEAFAHDSRSAVYPVETIAEEFRAQVRTLPHGPERRLINLETLSPSRRCPGTFTEICARNHFSRKRVFDLFSYFREISL